MSGYRHRRLRQGMAPGPRWIITVPGATAEVAELVKRRWREAGRTGVAVIDERVKVERGRR